MIVKIYDKVLQLADVIEIGKVNRNSFTFEVYIDGLDPIVIGLDSQETKKELLDNSQTKYLS